MKKTLSIILALCLALMMAVPALADYVIQDPNVTAPGEIPVVKDKITLSIGITQDSNIPRIGSIDTSHRWRAVEAGVARALLYPHHVTHVDGVYSRRDGGVDGRPRHRADG